MSDAQRWFGASAVKSCPIRFPATGWLGSRSVVGASGFDLTQVDIASLRLEDVPAIRSSIEDVATPFEPANGLADSLDCNDFGPDGFDDLTLKFDTQALTQALGDVQDGEVRVLTLTGVLQDGTPIEGHDVVVIKAKGGGKDK